MLTARVIHGKSVSPKIWTRPPMMLALFLSIFATSALSFALEVPLFPIGGVPGEIPGAIGPEYWVNKTTVGG